jgi:RHS repeat-associated protein
VTHNYDPLFRLISEQRVGSYAYTVSYEYDGAGNRLAKVWDGQRTDYVYDAADRLQFYVKPDGSVVAYDWDANGNMIVRTEGNQTTEFEYDYDNRLVRIVYPNGSEVRFGYDGLGRRVFRQEGANVRYFYYDGDRIIAEREGSSWVVRYLLGLKPCGHVVSGQVRVYHADRLGSVRWVTDGSQNIVVSYVYEGFGKVVGQSGGGGGPYQFCGLWGYRNDQDAGLLHVGARYYEVETGRWVQKDPLDNVINPKNLNKYVYCVNDPINRINPNGKKWRFPEWLIAIGTELGVIGAVLPGPVTTSPGVVGTTISPWLIWVGAVMVGIGLGYMISEQLGELLFPPDERCCGGQCDRNPPPKPLPPIRAISVWPFPVSAIIQQ